MRSELIAHIKPEYLEYRLCFVSDAKGCAYFTSNFETQDGRGWDTPNYEENAFMPWPKDGHDIAAITFISIMSSASEFAEDCCPYSANQINSGAAAWFVAPRVHDDYPPIHGGATLREFLQHKGIDRVSLPEHILTFGGEA